MVSQEQTWDELRLLVDAARAIADDVTVLLVANTKSSAAGEDVAGQRVSEYLSDNESAQLLGGLRDAGFRTRYMEGELKLIAAMLDSPGMDIQSARRIVYNIAQSGTDAGRKSLVPAFCALLGIPSCNSGSYAVSLARNKVHVSAILGRFGLPVPPMWAYSAATGSWLRGDRPPGDVRLIAKACHESSSVGLDGRSVGLLSDVFQDHVHAKSLQLRQPMVLQPLIEGREFEVPVVEMGSGDFRSLGPAVVTLEGDDIMGSRILDYDTVASDAYGFQAPARALAVSAEQARAVAAAVAEVLGLSGFSRVDFRVDGEGKPWVTDVATSPHLVHHGAFSHVFREAGFDHADMMAAMVGVNAKRLGWLGPA